MNDLTLLFAAITLFATFAAFSAWLCDETRFGDLFERIGGWLAGDHLTGSPIGVAAPDSHVHKTPR